MARVYLDTSVLNRPFDDQSQARIWLESLALSVILQMIEAGDADLVTSTALEYENSRNPYTERREWVERVIETATVHQAENDDIRQRALELEHLGIGSLDALHVASAEAAEVDFFLTVDDRLIRRYPELTEGKVGIMDPTAYVRDVAGRELE